MAEKQALKATFFTLQRRDRAVLLPATLVLVVIVALIAGVFIALNWSALQQFPAMFRDIPVSKQGDDNAAVFQFIGRIFLLVGSGLLLMFPLYFALACYETACLRWMIRGEAPGLFGFAVNDDTWRVYGVYWCWLITHFVISTAVGILMIPVMFATMGDMMRSQDPQSMMHWQFTTQLPFTLLQYCALIFVGVRFGPAAATSIARRRFSFFEAWTVTRDRFWALLGSYAVLWAGAIVATVAIFAATAGPAIMRAWPVITQSWSKASPEAVRTYFATIFDPANLALLGLGYACNLVVMLALMLMSYGVSARAALVALEEGKISVEPPSA